MNLCGRLIYAWVLVLLILAACVPGPAPAATPGPTPAPNAVETESSRDGVFTVRGGLRQALLAPQQAFLGVGEGVDVDARGRAILRFADLLTVEVLREGRLTVKELSADEQSAFITVLQNGGVLINDFNPQREITRRFTIQTEFATITAAGTRFMVVREATTPLEWVVGLDAEASDLEVTANGVTKAVTSSIARWMAPTGPPSAGISANMANVENWIEAIRSGETRPGVGETLWAQADILANTEPVTELPEPGQPFELEGVTLTLDPQGLFGNPVYALEDCNGDGVSDIAMQAGKLLMDFRPVPNRVRALDVTVINRDRPGSGSLRVLDPGQDEIGSQRLEAGPGQGQILTLRSPSGYPYHYAELLMSDGCFLGFSLTPPTADGEPGAPRPAVEDWQGEAEIPQPTPTPTPTPTPPPTPTPTPTVPPGERGERPRANGRMQALPVGADGYDVGIKVDGSPEDWYVLAKQSGLGWTEFDAVVWDKGCMTRYPAYSTAVARHTDLYGRGRFAYDHNYLYVAFLVDDDGYVAYTGDGRNFFQGDAPQLSLDVDLAGDFDENKVNEDDRQVDLLPGTDGPGDAPRVALWRLGPDRPTSQEFTEAMVAAAPTDSGYFLEAALPWKYMDFAPRPGARLGIAASVSDNDTPETNVQECMISTAPKRDWRDPTTWGTLILAEGRGSRPPEALPPRSELFPEARFALQEEHQLGSYVVRLWRNTTSETDWENIVTLAAGGQQLVQIEPVASLGDLTGKDITGEGHPDVIVERYSGGAHCCFSTAVYDLGPALTKVLETPESNCSGRFDDLDGDGVFEFVTCDDLFAYAYCPFAGSPMVKVILRYEPGRGYGPASPRFAHLYEGDIAEHTQLAEKTKPGEMGEWDGTTKCAVLPMVLDYLYAGMADRAWEEINRLYPYDDVKSFYAEIEQSVAKSPLFTPPR